MDPKNQYVCVVAATSGSYIQSNTGTPGEPFRVIFSPSVPEIRDEVKGRVCRAVTGDTGRI